MSHTVSTCPTIVLTTCPKVKIFGYMHVHAARMHICMHHLCNVVEHYIQYVCSNLYEPFFVIDCTRRKVVKMRKIVSWVYYIIFVHISNNSRASMVLFRQWFHWWISIEFAVGDFAINMIVLHKTPLSQPTPVTTNPGLHFIHPLNRVQTDEQVCLSRKYLERGNVCQIINLFIRHA